MVVYKRAVASMNCNPRDEAFKIPRNMKKLRNLRYKNLNQIRISQDMLYNIHELAYDSLGFVWKITTSPDLVCMCGLQEILDEADRVLTLDDWQLLSYDTTFQLGDFYFSPFIFRHRIFEENPCIPAMFLFHERKFIETHKEKFKECVKCIPDSSNFLAYSRLIQSVVYSWQIPYLLSNRQTPTHNRKRRIPTRIVLSA